jgi:hypothetical protein
VPYYLINRCNLDRGLVLKLGLKILLGVPCGSTKEVEYFSFFRKEIVIVNAELSSYLNPLILKYRVYPIRQWLGVRELNGLRLLRYYIYTP